MTLPTIPGVPNSGQSTVPQTGVDSSGLPNYSDIPVQGTTTSTYTPGTTEWWQNELGGLYGQRVLVGIDPTNVSKQTGKGQGGGRLAMPESPGGGTINDNNYQSTQDLFKQVMSLVAKSPQDFMSIQGLLYDAGFFGASPRQSVHWGQWTTETGDALKRALTSYEGVAMAGGVPISWSEFLGNAAQQGRVNQSQGGVGGAGTGAASQAVLTDPETLKATVQQAAQQSLDRALSPDELNKFVSHFQGLQQSAQTSKDATVTNPDASAQAQAFVQQGHQDEFQQHNVTAYSNSLLNLFLPSGSQLANFTPNASVA